MCDFKPGSHVLRASGRKGLGRCSHLCSEIDFITIPTFKRPQLCLRAPSESLQSSVLREEMRSCLWKAEGAACQPATRWRAPGLYFLCLRMSCDCSSCELHRLPTASEALGLPPSRVILRISAVLAASHSAYWFSHHLSAFCFHDLGIFVCCFWFFLVHCLDRLGLFIVFYWFIYLFSFLK